MFTVLVFSNVLAVMLSCKKLCLILTVHLGNNLALQFDLNREYLSENSQTLLECFGAEIFQGYFCCLCCGTMTRWDAGKQVSCCSEPSDDPGLRGAGLRAGTSLKFELPGEKHNVVNFLQLRSLFHGSTLIRGLVRYRYVAVSSLPGRTI